MTKHETIKNWTDYWKIFDQLCLGLTNRDKRDIVNELRDSKKYVNGLTDGWHQFLESFEKVLTDNSKDFTMDEKNYCDILLLTLKKSLSGR